jgi:hypothetical protein
LTTQTVNPAATATALVGTPNPSTSGQSVTFTATVTAVAPGAGTPAGTVTFMDETAGTTLGTMDLDANGLASIMVTDLTVGTHTIRATYAGNSNFATSNGSTTQTVNG